MFLLKILVVENGDFMFQTRSERCEHMEHMKITAEMNTVKIDTTGNLALRVNG